jgi:hypothetical protein
VTLHGELASDLIAIVRAESRTWAIDVGEIRTTGSPAAIKSRSIRRVMCRQSSIAHNRCSPSLAQLVGIGAGTSRDQSGGPLCDVCVDARSRKRSRRRRRRLTLGSHVGLLLGGGGTLLGQPLPRRASASRQRSAVPRLHALSLRARRFGPRFALSRLAFSSSSACSWF